MRKIKVYYVLEFETPHHWIKPRDANTAAHLAEWNHYPPPQICFTEHCFRHELPPIADGRTALRILNRPQGIAVTIGYDTAPLPRLVQWEKPSSNACVLGLEPTNASLNGAEFDQGHHFGKWLSPGESIDYQLELRFEAVDVETPPGGKCE